MPSTRSSGPSPNEIQEIARQTLASMEQRSQLLSLFHRRRKKLLDALATFRAAVRPVDPQQFTEDQFVIVDSALAQVIDGLETSLANHVKATDTAQCMFLGDSIRELRDARQWIVQGCSPDPSRRPTEEERRKHAEQHAADALTKLFV